MTKSLIKIPHPIFIFSKLYPFYKGSGPSTQGCFNYTHLDQNRWSDSGDSNIKSVKSFDQQQ